MIFFLPPFHVESIYTNGFLCSRQGSHEIHYFHRRENIGYSNQKPLSQQYSIKYCNTMPSLLRNVKELKEECRTDVFSAVIWPKYTVLSIET